ncbi:YeaH/YhbH family protein [Rhodocytophaga aerolata]|uniref:UPF0229 protein Q0590_17430 n=1 Tax=Rhodocytophaga aerolata TaxID=455078 RepID=A0ABT8R9N4_9BACT|nr:YeaH/YhbH family protein [Rhodocytophaga aerolata]MDO1448059.1 YeaH/YhbH family protein [Rhodocytophaga aerolata]
MSNIIDRRKNAKGKSTGNRQRFLKRVEGQIKKALPDIISQESIQESNTGGKVKVPIKSIKEPAFSHDPASGNKQIVRPGNDRFSEGDKIPKPKGSGHGGGRGKGSNSPEVSEDEFAVVLSREEFLKYFFEDLELPNMVQKFLENTESFENKRAGFIKYGNPSRLNIKTSYQQSLARQIALRGAFLAKFKKLEATLATTTDPVQLAALQAEIEKVKKQSNTIPFFEDVDLRYNHFEQIPLPTTSAAMFCIMDVSASMGYHEKDIAKRFFTLLYIFLTKQYLNVELIFIRHHTTAKEVDEYEFFNSKESGGTVVAPSLELMDKIIKERYSGGNWNIYCCQASDGDVWSDYDADECGVILRTQILPAIQYMAYIEISNHSRDSSLWRTYRSLEDENRFSMRKLYDVSQIWPVFRGLFKKEKAIPS